MIFILLRQECSDAPDTHSEVPALPYGVLNDYQTLSHEEIVENMKTSTLEFCEKVTSSQWVCVFTLTALD